MKPSEQSKTTHEGFIGLANVRRITGSAPTGHLGQASAALLSLPRKGVLTGRRKPVSTLGWADIYAQADPASLAGEMLGQLRGAPQGEGERQHLRKVTEKFPWCGDLPAFSYRSLCWAARLQHRPLRVWSPFCPSTSPHLGKEEEE